MKGRRIMGSEWSMPPMMPEQGSGVHPSPPPLTEARIPAVQNVPPAQSRLSRPTTITSALRVRQRSETVQQTISELSVLTEQLMELPERLARARLAHQRSQQLQEAMEAFADLAWLAWDGLATEKLDEVATTPAYRQRAVAATRRISRLQQEAATSRPVSPEGVTIETPSQRVGPLWNQRVRLYTDALELWRAGLGVSNGTQPQIGTLGLAMEDLRAAVGLAGVSGFNLVLFRIISWLGIILGGLAVVAYIAAAASAITLRLSPVLWLLTVVALFLMLQWSYGFWITSASALSLWKITGVVRWRLHEHEHDAIMGILTGWRWFTSVVITLAQLGALAVAAFLLRDQVQQPQGALLHLSSLNDVLLYLASGKQLAVLVALAGVLIAAPVVVALPFTLTYQVMLLRDMARHSGFMPGARRVALFPSLHTLSFHLLLALVAAGAPIVAFGAPWSPFISSYYFTLSPLALIIAGVIVVLYLACVDLPFRIGSARWRRTRLTSVLTQKHELSVRLEQLGPEPTVADDVPTMQYDVARLQYLRLQEDDIRREHVTAYSVRENLIALVIALATGVIAENALMWGTRLMAGH
jgi:hypothetical protein